MRKFYRNSGFSLLEVMVAVGLLSLVILGTMSLFEYTSKSQKKMTIKDDILNSSNQIRTILSDDNLCKTGLIFETNSQPKLPGALPENTQIPPTKNYSIQKISLNSNSIFEKNISPFPNVTIDEMTLSLYQMLPPLPSPPANTIYKYQAQLLIKFKTNDNSGSFRPLMYPMIISFDSTGNSIASCSVNASLTAQSICQDIFGGIFDENRSPACSFVNNIVSPNSYVDEYSGLNGKIGLTIDTTDSNSTGLNLFGDNNRITFYQSKSSLTGGTIVKSEIFHNPTLNSILMSSPGGVILENNISLNGNTTANYDLTVNNILTSSGTFIARSISEFQRKATFYGSGTSLEVNNNAFIRGNFSTSGTSIFSGSVNIQSHLTANTASFTTVTADTFTTTSDLNSKKDIQIINDQLENILKLNIYSYKFKNDLSEKNHFGVIAQEIQEIYPELVVKKDINQLSVNYIEMIPLLIKSIQEQNLQIELLKTQLKTQQTRINELEINKKNQ